MTSPASAGPGEVRVLVVDDEEDLRLMLVDVLGEEGFRVIEAADATAALEILGRMAVDVVLLDIMLPRVTGLDLLTDIRKNGDIPVIFVSGKGNETDRVLGLRLGADDYIVKPFSPAELVARVHSVLRRSRRGEASDAMHFDGIELDRATREVRVNGALVELTAKEFDLLAFLAEHPRQVFTRERLLDRVWSSSMEWQDSATVTEHVRRIRKKIEPDPDQPRWVRTVRGVGYRFEP